MNFERTNIPGVYVIKHTVHCDERGSFVNLIRISDSIYTKVLGNQSIRQVNISSSNLAGTVRGIHLQSGLSSESKIVTCIAGSVFDVAVDLRRGSSTYGEHFSILLEKDISCSLLIPKGVGHGFQSLQDHSEILYLHYGEYNSQKEAGVNIKDPILQIPWPMPITNISVKDQSLPFFV